MRAPEILIPDEATNALDGLSEAGIVETLKSKAGRRTTIVISHHHSTIYNEVVMLRNSHNKNQAPFSDIATRALGFEVDADLGNARACRKPLFPRS